MSFWSYWTGEDDALKTAQETNDAQRALNLRRYQEGRISLQQYQDNLRLLNGNQADIQAFDSVVGKEFETAVDENVQSLADSVQSVTSRVTGGIWAIIPWQLKVLGVLAVVGLVWFYVVPFFRARNAIAP